MVMRTLGAGSKYPVAYRDATGEFLNGSNTYKLHLPPNPPAALFWAVTAYNITDGTMVEAPQLMPSINGFNKVATTAMDQSICGSAPRNLRTRRNRTSSKPSPDEISWLHCGSMARASSSSTRAGSRMTS
jgi:hypothetical protein